MIPHRLQRAGELLHGQNGTTMSARAYGKGATRSRIPSSGVEAARHIHPLEVLGGIFTRARPFSMRESAKQTELSAEQSQSFWQGALFAERFFMGLDEVHGAMRKLCATLEADEIPYAVAGAMALNAHGYQRVTTDVDVLLTSDGLASFKEKRLGRGWDERIPGSRGMRDTEFNVKIDVLITGDYPGDGKPKAVSFPDPRGAIRGEGMMVLPVNQLVELKLASGITNPDRLKDLADLQELIRAAKLPLELGDEY